MKILTILLETTFSLSVTTPIRLKQRFSKKLNEFIQIDLTIIDVFTPTKQWTNSEYMIELEIQRRMLLGKPNKTRELK